MKEKSEKKYMTEIRTFLDELESENFNSFQLLEIFKGLNEDRLSVREIKEYIAKKEYSAEKMASIRRFLQENKLSNAYIFEECKKVSEELQKEEDIEIKRRRLYYLLETLDSHNFSELKINLHLPKELFTSIVFEEDSDGIMRFAVPFNSLKKLDLTNLDFSGTYIYGFDFTDTLGVHLDPQSLYHKDLRKGIFECVTFVGSFDDALINGADFTGSNGAVIDAETIGNHNISGFLDLEDNDRKKRWQNGEVNELIRPTILNDTTFMGDISKENYSNVVWGSAIIMEPEKGKKLVRK